MLSRRLVTIDESPIVQTNLICYFNSKRVNGLSWTNIAPATKGLYNGSISGATMMTEGMYFDGINDYVVIPTSFSNSGMSASSSFSYEFWIKRQNTSLSYLLGVEASSAGRIQISIDGVVTVYHGTSALATSTNPILPLDTLCHLIYTYDPNTDIYNYYLNGILFKSGTQSSNYSFVSPFLLGMASNQNYFKGIIPVFRFYSKVLTQTEVTQNFVAQLGVGL